MLMVITMTAGTGLIMWMGELITERGIGNGMSLLIFTSISARFPDALWAIQTNKGIEIFLLALITILLVAAIFIEVVCRYFLFISAAWAEEFTRYLFIWLTYIGSAYAICDNSHTEIDVLKQVLMKIKGPAREKWLKALEVAAIVSTFAFLVVFTKLFFDYMMKIFSTTQTSPTMRIPMGWVYLPVFIGIVLAALHEVYMLAACLLGGDKKSAAEADN